MFNPSCDQQSQLELEQYSRPQLVAYILELRQQLKQLRGENVAMKARLAQTEWGSQNNQERAVRLALRRLNQPAQLEQSDLARLIFEQREQRLNGVALQRLLRQAIEAQRPVKGPTTDSRSQLHYDLLRLTYLENKPVRDIISELPLSERQYHRELKAAIQQVRVDVLQ